MSHSRQHPPEANLRQLRNQAKDLYRACLKGDPNALHRIRESHPRFSGLTLAEIAAAKIVLADAQLVIARESGFDSWPRLKLHVDSASRPTSSMHELVRADDVQAMREAVAQDPESVNELNESGLPPLYTAALSRNQRQSDSCSSMEQLSISSPAPIWARRPTPKSCSSEIPPWCGNHPERHDRRALCGASGEYWRAGDSPALSSRRDRSRQPRRDRLALCGGSGARRRRRDSPTPPSRHKRSR